VAVVDDARGILPSPDYNWPFLIIALWVGEIIHPK
jgi:hypothetical protein